MLGSGPCHPLRRASSAVRLRPVTFHDQPFSSSQRSAFVYAMSRLDHSSTMSLVRTGIRFREGMREDKESRQYCSSREDQTSGRAMADIRTRG